MRRRGSNLLYHELLGLEARIVSSTDPGVEGLEGLVVGETMKTIVIRSRGRSVTTFKIGTRYRFRVPETGEEVEVDGDRLYGRPEDRARRVLGR